MPKPKTHERFDITLPIEVARRVREVKRATGQPFSQQIARALEKKLRRVP